MIEKFINIPEDKYQTCGGKGKSLVEMYKEGFSVPDGFIINSEEFSDFCNYNGLNNVPLEKIHEKILEGVFPQKMQEEISDLFNSVFTDDDKVAVRSSALCEDSTEYSWSGELETYLFVDEKHLFESIKRCFSSIFTQRALAYSRQTNINRDDMKVAVVVQRQINSHYSGVAFSNNPLTGDNVITVEVVEGQGDRLVSGKVTPDRYTFSMKMEQIDVHLNKNNRHISDENLHKVVCEVEKLKKFYEYAVDVEWSIYNNQLFILQCRPITTIMKENKVQNILFKLFPTSKWVFDTQGDFNYVIMKTIMNAAEYAVQDRVFGFHRQIEDCLRLNGQIYKSVSNKQILSDVISAKMEEDEQFLEHFANKWKAVSIWEQEYVEHLLSIDWEKISNNVLIEEILTFENKYTDSLVYVYFYIENFLEELFVSSLKTETGFTDSICKEIFNSIASCSNSLGSLLYSEEPIDLMRMAIKKQEGEDISNLLNDHVEKYGWMLAPIERKFQLFEKKHYEQRIDQAISEGSVAERLNTLLNSKKENDEVFTNTIRNYHLSSHMIKLANIIRSFVFYRTLLTERSDWLFYNGRITILREISKRINIPENDLVMLSLAEISSFLQGQLSRFDVEQTIKNRTKHYAIIYIDGELLTLDGEDAITIENEFVPLYIKNKKAKSTDLINDKLILEGTTCFPGRIVGRVKIVRSLKDCDKIQKGDILVANMTTPNFISAMERASGFITDQGGITCHAAILSREMKIPCIIGTSIATKVLKDDDVVELDSYTGLVKLL